MVEAAELEKRWMGDVGAWCLPGYGVPLAVILLKEGENKCLVLSKHIFSTDRQKRGLHSA